MFKRISIIFLALTFMMAGSLTAEEIEPDVKDVNSKHLENIFNRYFEDMQRMSPEFATFVGLTSQYNDHWSDYSEEGIYSRHLLLKAYLEDLLSVDRSILSAKQQISYDVFHRLMKESIEDYHFNSHFMALNHLSGAPLDAEQVILMMPRNSREDYHHILVRLDTMPTLIDQTMHLLDKGLEHGLTPPRIAIRSLPVRIENLIAITGEASVFFQPFTQFPLDFSQNERDDLAEKAVSLINGKVNPAYQKLYQYITDKYLPGCRETIGTCDLPNGSDYYQFCVNSYTTTTLSPFEVHVMGLSEVGRIRKEMEQIIEQIGFEGSLTDFLYYLNHDQKFFYDTPENFLAGYREITRFIDGQLPILFGKFPKLPYEIVPVPAYSEENQVSAYYMRGSISTGRPGRFYVNTYDLGSRPKWQMESLSLHEAVPGHHFQISIAQEDTTLPEFRKYTGFTAYIEGWGLYSESLGSELGLYRDPYSKFGRLIEEVWRAVRLVVDTGMHSLGWSREEAIDYFVEHTGIARREASTEIDRYLVWPGQALAYKIGELTIKKWRHMGEEILGDNFDIRDFHDVLLQQGALPLDICEKQMLRWIESKMHSESVIAR